MRLDHPFLKISGVLYLGLMTNVLIAATALPLLIVLMTTDPRHTWPAVAVCAVLAVPALPAAFKVFALHSDEGERAVVRPFFRAWWGNLRRSLLIGAMLVGAVTVLAVDIVWVMRHDAATGSQVGAIAVPIFAILIVLSLFAGLGALVGILERPDASLFRLLKAALYLMLRRWYLALVSLACGGVFVLILAERPALGMGVVATPLLYLVWANTRHTLKPILPAAVTSGPHGELAAQRA